MSKENKHTPGPWEAIVEDPFYFVRAPQCTIQYPGDREIPVEILGDDGYGEEYENQRIPDVYLVAASPDMLEAISYALDVLWSNDVSKVVGMTERSVFDKLKNAQQKARNY